MEGTVGEIRIFAGNFPPYNWAFCNGATLQIAQNPALYSLLGTTYGGDGKSTFKIPNITSPAEVGQQGQYIICLQGLYPRRP